MGAEPMPKGTRVAFISQGLGRITPPHAQGSIATWTYETARHLARDYSLVLIELGEQPVGTREIVHDGATYIYVPAAVNRVLNAVHTRLSRIAGLFLSRRRRMLRPAYASLFHNLGYILQAAWQARRSRCDVIHIHNFSQFVPVVRALNPVAFLALHMNCEWLSQHDPAMIGRRLKHVDAVICCSGHVRRRLLEVFPEMSGKSHVVYNGANVERFLPSTPPPAGRQECAPRLLFVGRISPEKGVHLLASALPLVAARFPDVSLHLVGGAGSLPADFLVGLSRDPLVKKLESFYGGDYAAEVKRRIPPELAGRVVFHGNVAHSELGAHYRDAALFVCPSLSDAFPLTVVEAMAAGLPVVGSTVGGIPEAVVDGVTGALVEPDNPEALAAGIIRLLEDAPARRRMAQAARERALTMFSWRAISGQLVRVYSEAAEERRRMACTAPEPDASR